MAQKKEAERRLLWWWLAFWLAGCGGAAEKQTALPALVTEARISGEEGRAEVVCLLQFKADSSELPVRLPANAFIMLDGEELQPDSARYAGVFYEKRMPLDGFAGEHELVYKTGNRQYKTRFTFRPFQLPRPWPATLSRRQFAISTGNGTAAYRLLMTDTAFATDDFHEMVKVRDGRLSLPPQQLTGLKPGPVQMELIQEENLPLASGWRGRLQLSFAANREFRLVE